MATRRLVVVLALVLAAPVAHADVAIGAFIGQPTGLDVKLGLTRRTGLDLLAGTSDVDCCGNYYGHLTYLVTPVVGRGDSVLVPLRIGIGVALFEVGGDHHVDVAARLPVEVALRFRRAPLELYGELALKATIVQAPDQGFDLDGGLGVRFYF